MNVHAFIKISSGMCMCTVQSVTFFSEQGSRKKRPISSYLKIQQPTEPRDFSGFVDGWILKMR